MKQILVLGGGGFIGRNIVSSLLERGGSIVTAADIQEGSNWSKLADNASFKDRFKPIIDDFTDIQAFNRLNQSFDEIYMLAAVVGVNRTLESPQDVVRINTLLTMNTLDYVSRNPIKRLLFSSSSENYAGTSDLFNIEIPTPESVPLCIEDVKHPRWTYAITKMHGELAFFHSSKSLKYECVIVRYQNIIGPEMGFGHAIPHISERFFKANESPFKIYGHDQTRAFCYIDDAVNGTIGAMESEKASDQIYHIGMDHEINMETLTKYIGSLYKYSGEYKNAITYPGSVSRRCPDINKARNDFGYNPEISWEDAVRLTVEWYKEFFEQGNIPNKGGFRPPENFIKKDS